MYIMFPQQRCVNKALSWGRMLFCSVSTWLSFILLQEGTGQWVSLDAELVMRDGEVVATKTPTGDSLLLDCRFELPFGELLISILFYIINGILFNMVKTTE